MYFNAIMKVKLVVTIFDFRKCHSYSFTFFSREMSCFSSKLGFIKLVLTNINKVS